MPSRKRHDAKPASTTRKAKPPEARGPPPPKAELPVIVVGASAGGLEACTKLLTALPADTGMAFIIVQHLDPTHPSMLPELLAAHTHMRLGEATDGETVAADHVYIIPPGTYLTIAGGALHLSKRQKSHGARLPLDHLLKTLAGDCGSLAGCVILSGTGADGSLGLTAVAEADGFVIAQEPKEAGYDGMPRSAIATERVDLILPIAKIPRALIDHFRHPRGDQANDADGSPDTAKDHLAEILELLRAKTAHDFRAYKPGTMRRRIARRMGMASIFPHDSGTYLKMLLSDSSELDLLAKDLLINVTSFFRDPPVFERLAKETFPDLVRMQPLERPLRIWIAGCSTGEEAYSIAIIACETVKAERPEVKLQIFASDVDQEAVAIARDGVYSASISDAVSPERLKRFFSEEKGGYRVSTELRGLVVFTVQDVLVDPPFSRLDLVSCRNLLIYLGPEAQAKVMGVFHFALRQNGILLLGIAENAGDRGGRFEVISKAERLFRHVGRNLPGDFDILTRSAGDAKAAPSTSAAHRPSRQSVNAELCRRLVLEDHAPATVLINDKHECLFSLGAIDRYLRLAPGHPTNDILALAPTALRIKLRSAIKRAALEEDRILVPGGLRDSGSAGTAFDIEVRCVSSEGEKLTLISFIDTPARPQTSDEATPEDEPRIARMESELQTARSELQAALQSLEMSGEEQKAINQEALSVNEEFQTTNEELLTSKEELQALNEELTALNGQLQETLDRQRTTTDDLQNVLYSTDVATLFLDTELKIRFFTPATRHLFNVIPGDVGRPLTDLRSLAVDASLAEDAKVVLETGAAREHEVETEANLWCRRMLPYRTHDGRVEGVVITFIDITERVHAARNLDAARKTAELADTAKSRFLAAASHDLRQPLQSLALLHGLLAKAVVGEKAQHLVARLDQTLGAMSGMLNALLDINQIEAGVVGADPVDFPIDDLLTRVADEFSYHASAKRLQLRVVRCTHIVRSDPRLLEQMVRNLIANALKYTVKGKILIGCRHTADSLKIQVCDTGIGIAEDQLHAIFDEFHQVDNAARERSRGLGLGLSIVQRLGALLGHEVTVQSRVGKGSVFSVTVARPHRLKGGGTPNGEFSATSLPGVVVPPSAEILVVDDDPDIRELFDLLLTHDGHRITTASDGVVALELIKAGLRPDLVLADFNLPNGTDGLEMSRSIREKLGPALPVIIVTGDISEATLRDISEGHCDHFHKPVKARELTALVSRLLSGRAVQTSIVPKSREPVGEAENATVFVVDDDDTIRGSICSLLKEEGLAVECFPDSESFLAAYRPGTLGCLLIDAYLPGLDGVSLLQHLRAGGQTLPAIMITGSSDVQMAVLAMKAGATDFMEKPIGSADLLAGIHRALDQARDASKLSIWRDEAAASIADLTPRQHQIMSLVLAGEASKNIAIDLGISQRTVENHRAAIMKRTGSKSLPALARMALAVSSKPLA